MTYPSSHRAALLEAAAQITAAAQSDRERLRQGVRPTNERPKAVTITDRIPLPVQLATIERMLARAKTETDWPAIPALKATAELIRWMIANADAVKVAAAAVRHPISQAIFAAFRGAEITAIHEPR